MELWKRQVLKRFKFWFVPNPTNADQDCIQLQVGCEPRSVKTDNITFKGIPLQWIYFNIFHCIVLHLIAYHCIRLHYFELHCITLYLAAFNCKSGVNVDRPDWQHYCLRACQVANQLSIQDFGLNPCNLFHFLNVPIQNIMISYRLLKQICQQIPYFNWLYFQ